MERALALLGAEFDWVVVDLGRGWGEGSVRALDALTHLLLLTQAEVPCLVNARRQLDLANTGAPVAGVLTAVFEEVGATVRRGDVLARIADLASFRVEAKVSDAYSARLDLGQDVHVLVDDQRLAARVSGILPTIDEECGD